MNIRISARSQYIACQFTERLLPHLANKLSKPLRLAAVCQREDASAFDTPLNYYMPIEEWRFEDALDLMQRLHREDVNVLILSEDCMNNGNSVLSEDHMAYETACTKLGINIIHIEKNEGVGDLLFDSGGAKWTDISLASILGIMSDDYRKEPLLCAPWGGVPYFIIEPDFDASSKSIRLLAGFQTWSYEHLLDEFVPEKYLFTHWTPVEHMTHSKKMGPVPFRCC